MELARTLSVLSTDTAADSAIPIDRTFHGFRHYEVFGIWHAAFEKASIATVMAASLYVPQDYAKVEMALPACRKPDAAP